jgi:hypothetical protein
MADEFQTEVFDSRSSPMSRAHPPVPPWLAQRWLRPDEGVTWVAGPRFNPSWERYVTHPALVLVALALAVVWVGAGSLIGGAAMPALLALPAGGLLFASIVVLGLSSGYFTRLVVTDSRLFVLQGYEMYRAWQIDDLPRSLVRYRARADGGRDWAVDLDAMKTMLGSASEHFTDSKTILAFSKQLGRIKSREDDRS